MTNPNTSASSAPVESQQLVPQKRKSGSILDPSRKLRLEESVRMTAMSLLSRLTIEEKTSLLTASDHRTTAALPDRNVPAITMTRGCNGVVGDPAQSTKAAQFPCGTSLAATWNKSLLYQVGQHLANETRAQSAHLLLGPNVCLHRHPFGGLNTSSFSEDPFPTGKLAAQYIKGLQDEGIASSVQYFMGNTQEMKPSDMVHYISERPVRELYLRPFEIALREAKPWAMTLSICPFNVFDTAKATNFIKKVVREEWKYDGVILPYWFAEDFFADFSEDGCDILLPRSSKNPCTKVQEAFESGRASMGYVDEAVQRVLTLVERVKGGTSGEATNQASAQKEAQQVIRNAGHEGLTLLKNEGNLLPICRKTTKIAVIGPNANRAISSSGGRAFFRPYYRTIPLQSIRQISELEVSFAQGCHTRAWLPMDLEDCTNDLGDPGISVSWYAGNKFEGDAKIIEHRNSLNLFLGLDAPEFHVGSRWSAIATTYFKPRTTGTGTINFASTDIGQLFINGEMVADASGFSEKIEDVLNGPSDHLVSINLEKGAVIKIEVKMANATLEGSGNGKVDYYPVYAGCRIGFKLDESPDDLQKAIEVAQAADIAVVIVGLDHEWDFEGLDRRTMDLPFDGSQDTLIEAVVKANSRTVVVNQSGGPVHMPWAEKVPVIIQAWYQGQEAGNALADVLFGLANPSGKLPMTFPKRIEHTPAFHSWLDDYGKVLYGEDLYVGYRHYDRTKIAPLFPFGHGLSYTTFEYGHAQIQPRILVADGKVKVTLAITNTGSRAGAEIVQLYIHDEKSKLPRPEKELVAFEKIVLDTGETKHVTISLDKYAVGFYDESIPGWLAEKGTFEVLIGASSGDIRRSVKFSVEKSFNWVF